MPVTVSDPIAAVLVFQRRSGFAAPVEQALRRPARSGRDARSKCVDAIAVERPGFTV